MSFFKNLKTILFEEDPEQMPPDYEEQKKEKEEVKVEEVKVEPEVKVVTESRVKIKRDLEVDDKDILDSVPAPKVNNVQTDEVKVRQVNTDELPKREKSVFADFDETEFNRLNSRIERNENKSREVRVEPRRENNDTARRANNNFSATSTLDKKIEGPKKFKPSPVLSPVFGVLNVNYTTEDIVDKKDGIKREKLKPIKKVEEKKVPEEIKEDMPIEVDIDSVRRKAYGELEDLEKTLLEDKDVKKNDFIDKDFTSVEVSEPIVDEVIDEPQEEVIIPEETIISEEVNEEIVNEETIIDLDTDEEENKPRLLDDLEKTSTLQILDDIEKELNAIKPINKDEVVEEIKEEEEPSIEKSDTLENDLFNLIDSMYTDKEDK